MIVDKLTSEQNAKQQFVFISYQINRVKDGIKLRNKLFFLVVRIM